LKPTFRLLRSSCSERLKAGKSSTRTKTNIDATTTVQTIPMTLAFLASTCFNGTSRLTSVTHGDHATFRDTEGREVYIGVARGCCRCTCTAPGRGKILCNLQRKFVNAPQGRARVILNIFLVGGGDLEGRSGAPPDKILVTPMGVQYRTEEKGFKP